MCDFIWIEFTFSVLQTNNPIPNIELSYETINKSNKFKIALGTQFFRLNRFQLILKYGIFVYELFFLANLLHFRSVETICIFKFSNHIRIVTKLRVAKQFASM